MEWLQPVPWYMLLASLCYTHNLKNNMYTQWCVFLPEQGYHFLPRDDTLLLLLFVIF